MSKEHTPTPRNYLQNAINRINDLIPLAELGLQYQESKFYHPDQTKSSREDIGMAKRFVEYTEKHPDIINNHDRLVEALEDMIEWHGEGVKKKSFRDVMSAAKQLLTELKQQQ